MQSTQQTITLDDGATTTLERWGSSGPVMLCVHGMTSSRKAWMRTAQYFGDRYQVVAYDQRGHGDSAAITGSMSLARGIRDLHNVAEVTGADVVIGHSWGGAVAIRGGELIATTAIVAIDPMLVQAGDDWYAEYIEELDDTFALRGDARDARVREDFGDWPAGDVTGKVHAMHAMTSAPIAGLRDENRSEWDLRADVAIYNKPLLLVMAGREGSIVPAEIIDEITAHHAPAVHIVTFEDQGHNLYRTAFDRFAAVVDDFITGR